MHLNLPALRDNLAAIRHANADNIGIVPVVFNGEHRYAIAARFTDAAGDRAIVPLAIMLDDELAQQMTHIAGRPTRDATGPNGEPESAELPAQKTTHPAPRPSNN